MKAARIPLSDTLDWLSFDESALMLISTPVCQLDDIAVLVIKDCNGWLTRFSGW